MANLKRINISYNKERVGGAIFWGFIIYCLIIAFFSLLFFVFNVSEPKCEPISTSSHVNYWECLYRSFVSFNTMGFGNPMTRSISEKVIGTTESIIAMLYIIFLSAFIAYNLLKRHSDIVLSNNLYLQKDEDNNGFWINVRVGNPSGVIYDCTGVFQFYEVSIGSSSPPIGHRECRVQYISEERFFKTVWHCAYHIMPNSNPSNCYPINDYLIVDNTGYKYITFTFSGLDAKTGDRVTAEKTYSLALGNIKYITKAKTFFEWGMNGLYKSPPNWSLFHQYQPLKDNDIVLVNVEIDKVFL